MGVGVADVDADSADEDAGGELVFNPIPLPDTNRRGGNARHNTLEEYPLLWGGAVAVEEAADETRPIRTNAGTIGTHATAVVLMCPDGTTVKPAPRAGMTTRRGTPAN